MAILSTGNQLRAVATAPAVAVGFAVLALLVVRTGCSPPYADTDFFGVPVTLFLLLALTATALILIVFAGINAWRTWRVLRRRRRSSDEAATRVGFIGVILAVLAFAFASWLGITLLLTPCP